MGGGGSVAPPQPSAAEQALQTQQASLLQKQTDILTEQDRQQKLLAPLLFKQSGIQAQTDADGKITGFTQIEDPNKPLSDSITTGLLQREKDALGGNLPVDKNLTDELDTEDRTLHQALQQNLGPGYATSSPGIEALSKQALRRAQLTQSVSSGELSNAAALAQGQTQQTSDLQAQSLNKILGAQQSGTQFASLYGNASNNYTNAIQPYIARDQLSLNASIANQQARSASSASGMSLAGAGLGAATAAAIAI